MNLGTLVLAAGKSTRIAPIAQGEPKPLLEVGGRPVIEWVLGWLARWGIGSLWVNLHYRAGRIRRALGTGERHGLRIRYAEEPTILGTAGAWKGLEDEWRGTSLVVYGDNLMRFDLRRFLEVHRSRGAAATIALFDPDRNAHTGIAGGYAVRDDTGRIVEFVEGGAPPPGERLVNAGAYLLEPDVLAGIGPGFQDFGADVFPQLVEAGRVHGHRIERGGVCLGLDTPAAFATAQELIDSGEVVLS